MEFTKETGCQTPEGPILCINNCGFFGSAATMNMCSKCHKDMILKQEQAKLAASSFDNIVNGGGSGKDVAVIDSMNSQSEAAAPMELKTVHVQASPCDSSSSHQISDAKAKEGPSRCNTCRKRVGLTGFSCKCGNLFCSAHRYSDKHDCPFDYQTAGRDAIAKANPVIKAEKLEKI